MYIFCNGPRQWWRWACIGLIWLGGTSTGFAQQIQETPETLYASAYQLFNSRLYDQGAAAFSDFRTKYPAHQQAPEALFYEGICLLETGREAEGIERFQQFQRQHPTHPLAYDTRLTLGKYFYETEQYPLAIQTLDQVLAGAPNGEIASKALYWMGESAINEGNMRAGIGHLQQVVDEYPTSTTAPLAIYTIGFTLAEDQRYNEAADYFEHLHNRYPDSPYAQNIGLSLAEVYYELGDYRQAIIEIERRFQQLNADSQQRATFLLAECHNQLRNSEDAILYYRRFTDDNPDSPYHRRALFGLGWNYHFEGVYGWAAEHFERAHRGQDDDLAQEAMYYEAANLKLAGQLDPAKARYAEVVQRWPNSPWADDAQFERAMTIYEARQWRAAVDEFQELRRRYRNSPHIGEATRMMGEAYVALGDYDRAFEAYDDALNYGAATPDLVEAVQFQKAWLLYRENRYAEAEPLFLNLHETLQNGEKAGESLFWAAECNYQLQRYGRAVEIFQQFQNAFPTHPQANAANYAIGWTFFRQKDYPRAIREFRQFLQNYQETDQEIPYRTDAQLRLADSYFALKDYPSAHRAYLQVEGDGADYALYQAGQAHANAGNNFEAINTFRTLLAQFAVSEWCDEAQYALGYLYVQNGDYDRAIEEYHTLIRRYPDSNLRARAQYGIGDAHYNAQQYPEAMQAYRTVIRRYNNSAFVSDAVTGLLYVALAMDDEDAINQVIEEFAANNPNSPLLDELRFRQAEIQYQNGDFQGAIDLFLRFVRVARTENLLANAYLYLGRAYGDIERPREAESYLRQVTDNYADSPSAGEAFQLLGGLYLADQRFDPALQMYQRLAQIAQADPFLLADAQYGQGMALLGLNRAAEAESLLTAALTTSAPDTPASLKVNLGLAQVYERLNQPQRAYERYVVVRDRSQDELGAEAIYRLGDMLVRTGNPQNARLALDELGKLPVLYTNFPDWVAQGYLLQARAYLIRNEKGNAIRMYDTVIAEFPETAFSRQAEREKAAL